MVEIHKVPSPNFGRRSPGPINILVVHYTAMASAEAALERLSDPASEVSSHYLIAKTGEIYQLVDEADRAWHAGVAKWGRYTDVNSRSIGIELDNIGIDDQGAFVAFPDVQLLALRDLMTDILGRHAIPARHIVGHSDIAPTRKQDPGNRFPWHSFAEAGIGAWPISVTMSEAAVVKRGDSGSFVRQFQQKLRRYGYGLQVDGQFGSETEAVVTAFQRHFRGQRVDGIGDGETQDILAALLRNA